MQRFQPDADSPGTGAASGRPCAPVPEDAVVLGIDPGTRVLGYGAVRGPWREPILVEAGVVRVDARRSLAERLERIAREVEALLADLCPTIVVVERAFAGRNVQSALRLGECRGVVLAAAARSGAIVAELSPAQAKRALAGHGAAGKGAVADLVLARLAVVRGAPQRGAPVPGTLAPGAPPADATDALALAMAWQQGVAPSTRSTRSTALPQELLARLASSGPRVAGMADLPGGTMRLSRRRPQRGLQS